MLKIGFRFSSVDLGMAFACTVLNVLELREGVRAVSEVTIPHSSVALVFVCFNVMSDMKALLCCASVSYYFAANNE